jgi:hypothetical protein
MADTKHHASALPVETDGISYSGIVWFVVILTVTTLVCMVLMWALLKAFKYQADSSPAPSRSQVASAAAERPAAEGRVYPQVNAIGPAAAGGPQLLVNEPMNLAAQQAREHQMLTTYGWADQNAGTIRIPLDKAKELLLPRGLPVRGQTPVATPAVK